VIQFIVSGNVAANRVAIHPRYIMLNVDKMARTIDISEYTLKNVKKLSIFRLEARPFSSPIDMNLAALLDESSWNLSDRLRFWHAMGGASPVPGARLTIRKLDFDEKALVHCQIEVRGELTILSNSRDYAMRFFRTVFTNSPPAFVGMRNWKVKSRWVKDKTSISFFAGSAASALGWGPKVPHEIEATMREALRGLEGRSWKPCVVMCRRALQALMEAAYEKFFSLKPSKGLDLNAIIRKFEGTNPLLIPRHWLNIADAVRNIGNVPGAHPRAISGYRFSKSDAVLAYNNTAAFVSSYFEKIAP
jgi:hypothetical protein